MFAPLTPRLLYSTPGLLLLNSTPYSRTRPFSTRTVNFLDSSGSSNDVQAGCCSSAAVSIVPSCIPSAAKEKVTPSGCAKYATSAVRCPSLTVKFATAP